MLKSLKTFSVMPLDLSRIDDIVSDIVSQKEKGISDCPLFMMKLVPEGNPPISKASSYKEQFLAFKNKLDKFGVNSGILVQCSIGHGYKLNEISPFTRVENLTDGEKNDVYCPFDKNFLAFMQSEFEVISSFNPDFILVDDDMRLIFRSGKGCCCPLHLKAVNDYLNLNLTREQLLSEIQKNTKKGQKFWKAFYNTQKQSLLQLATYMRRGIDNVNPNIQAGFCALSNIEFGGEIAKILAGKFPSVIRLNTGNYTPMGAREISKVSFRASYGVAVLKNKADFLLAETDTCPQFRYSTGAYNLHANFVANLLEGVNGAKHWITRLDNYEKCDAYQNILSKYRGFYDYLVKTVPKVKWFGFNIPVPDSEQDKLYFAGWQTPSNAWARCSLERLGLPIFFSFNNDGVVFIDNDAVEYLSNLRLKKIFKGKAVLSSLAIEKLAKRGFLEYIGVNCQKYDGLTLSYEKISGLGKSVNIQKSVRKLVPLNDDVKADSYYFHKVGDTETKLFPASTVYKNSLGGTVVSFSGDPNAVMHYTEGFAFLNSTRKSQFIRLFKEELPLYYSGDAELFLKAGYLKDGSIFVSAINLGFDPIENFSLICKKNISSAKLVKGNGTKKSLKFSKLNDSLSFDFTVYPLTPVVLLLK